MSPSKKRRKITNVQLDKKRENETDSTQSNKRLKLQITDGIATESNEEKQPIKEYEAGESSNSSMASETLQSKKRKNFVTACEEVSRAAYFNIRKRLMLTYIPACQNCSTNNHQQCKNGSSVNPIPDIIMKSCNINLSQSMWYDAIEVCDLSVTTSQYLTADMLKDIVEIMMNAHEMETLVVEYSIETIIEKCQQLLSKHFVVHPPCQNKALRKCYLEFLQSSLNSNEKRFSNRKDFECDKGIIKYCWNRLEHEISKTSNDGPLVDKEENIPKDKKDTVAGLHWQKANFEIYEMLTRPERIERLMVVLESTIELLKYDLALWLKKCSGNAHYKVMMRSTKPLMVAVLWPNIYTTGGVNNICKQIFRVFVQCIQLNYPEQHLRILSAWMNTLIQTIYICDNDSNRNYPNTGKYSKLFASEFYKVTQMSDMPQSLVVEVLKRIQPAFMRHLIGLLDVQEIFKTEKTDIIDIMMKFLEDKQWEEFNDSNEDNIDFKANVLRPIKTKKLFDQLMEKCNLILNQENSSCHQKYPKFDEIPKREPETLSEVLHTLYVTLEAYFNAYSLETVQSTIEELNMSLTNNESNHSDLQPTSYYVTEVFVKKYRSIFEQLKQLLAMCQDMKEKGKLPSIMKNFSPLLLNR